MKAIFIAPQCEPVEITIPDGERESYEQVRALVGGIIDCVQLGENVHATINDEGLLIGLPPNLRYAGVMLAGNVVIQRTNDAGDSISTTDEDLATARAWVLRCERPGRFDYDVPPARIIAGKDFDEYMKSGKMPGDEPPPVVISGVSGVHAPEPVEPSGYPAEDEEAPERES